MEKFKLLLIILLLSFNEKPVSANSVSGMIVQDTITEISENKKSDTVNHESLIRELNAIEDNYEVIHNETKASYYHDKFHGRTTANGEKFSNSDMTAAHKTLPFGTKVRVTNLRNSKSVIVEINDRGPFIKGRKIDLSQKAFNKLSNKKKGVISVKIEVLKDNIL